MKHHFRILVGAAVGLTLTPAPLPAFSRDAQPLAAPIILAQAEGPSPEEEELLRKKRKGAERKQAPQAEKPARASEPSGRPRLKSKCRDARSGRPQDRATPSPRLRQSPRNA